jgi:hypothetical protein
MEKSQKVDAIVEILEELDPFWGSVETLAERIIDALEQQQQITRYILESGNHQKFDPFGDTVQFDHAVLTFEVSIRTMGRITCEGIKDYLERKHEVVSIEEIDTMHVVRKL